MKFDMISFSCTLIKTVENQKVIESWEGQLYITILYPLLIISLVMKHCV